MPESPPDGSLAAAAASAEPPASPGAQSPGPVPARRRPPDAKARTQARILAAAAALFAARGYEGASITAIAGRAHVSRSAVFWHFGDKETLFRETFRQMLVPFAERIANSLTHPDPSVRLLELLSVYERFVDEQKSAIQAFVRWTIESPTLQASIREPLFAMHDHFARDVSEALAQAVGDAASAEAMAMGILSMLHGNLLLAMVDGDPRRARLRRVGLRSVVERALASGSGAGTSPASRSSRGDP